MRYWTLAGAVVCLVAGLLSAWALRGDDRRGVGPETRLAVADDPAPEPGSAIEQAERSLGVRAGSREEVGRFELQGAGSARLHTATTVAGRSCLIEVGPDGDTGATCGDGELFGVARIVHLVSSDGGPARFTRLRVSGIAAPGVVGVSLVLRDGRSMPLALTSRRAFLFESSPADLERDVLPVSLRAFGRGGRVLEEVKLGNMR